MRRSSLVYEFCCASVRIQCRLPYSVLSALMLLALFASSGRAAQWIWTPEHAAGSVPQTSCYFRTSFVAGDFTAAKLVIAGDDTFEVYLNGRRIVQGSGWEDPKAYNIQPHVEQGNNVLAIKVSNTRGNTAGLLCSVEVTQRDGRSLVHASDATWKASTNPLPFWQLPRYADNRWPAAQSLGNDGETEPWIREEAVAARSGTATRRQTQNSSPVDAPQDASNEQQTTSAVEQNRGQRDVLINVPKFRTQPDFEVQILATHDQTGSLIATEFNEFHELLLAQENGPLLLMVDTNKDAIPDSVRVYCDEVKNVQGILPLNGDVFVTAEGPNGPALYRLGDKNRDGKLEVVATLIKFEHAGGEPDEAMGEHGAHGLAIGPDGHIYVAVGNHAQPESGVAASSPYATSYEGDIVPRYEDPGGHAVGIPAPGGSVLRVPVGGGKVERVAGGLRNAYDLVFDQWGNLFTHDSDMESDEGSLWYRPTRINHIIPGGEYGWRSGWAKWSDTWYDGLPPTINTGRGSPTGIAVYDHFSLPDRFHHDILACDWTHGRILHIDQQNNGASFNANSETLLEGEPLTITDLTVGPDGWLYFVSGGRETAGGVYRLVYTGETPTLESRVGKGISAAIRYPQFQSAWARQAIAKIKQADGDRWDVVLPAVARTTKNSTRFRVRALDLMHLYGPTIDSKTLIDLSQDEDAHVRAKAAELMGLGDKAKYQRALAALLRDDDAGVRRIACAALVRCGGEVSFDELKPLLNSEDRYEAFAARRLLESLPAETWQEAVLMTPDHRLFIQGGAATVIANGDKATAKAVLDRFAQLLPGFITDNDFIDMLRLVQIAVERGQITADDAPEFAQAMAAEFPSANTVMNRELLRILVGLNVSDVGEIKQRYIKYLQSNLDPAEHLHVALHLAMLDAQWTSPQRLAIVTELDKAQQASGGASRSGYINSVARQFAGKLTDEEKQQVLVKAAQMPTAALSVLYHLPENLDAATLASLRESYLLLDEQDSSAADQLQIGIIAVLGESGDATAMDFIREQYPRDPNKQAYLAMALAQQPAGANWPLLVDALRVVDGGAARMVLKALATVNQAPDNPEPYRWVIIRGLELGENGGNLAAELLQHWTGEQIDAGGNNVAERMAAWQAWFKQNWPDQPPAVLPTATAQTKWILEDLLAHLENDTNLAAASADRGAHVFAKAQCNKCHRHGDTGEALGPDLTAVSSRFRKKELLESIIFPSHVISDQYRAKTVITDSGKQYTGIVARGAPGEVVVLQQDGRKVVLKSDQIEETVPSKQSAMPDGLLEDLTLEEVTDLFAYLNGRSTTATAQRPKRD